MPYYACIIGACQDWPEQRCSRGDIGLARCLADQCHLPKENIAEVYDERATRSNILRALEGLLDRRNASFEGRRQQEGADESEDTLLVHYGGHGKRDAFCTQRQGIVDGKLREEPWIKHSEIIDLLERKFKGGTALFVIDCCHSGGLGEAVLHRYNETKSLNVKYGCMMSVPPADEAGEEWTMTECLIRAFKGEIRCYSDESKCCYYLSTKKGKHPVESIDDSRVALNMGDSHDPVDDACTFHPTWGQILEYLADEMARLKGDRLTTLFLGEGMEDGSFLSKPCAFGDSVRVASSCESSQTARIPRDDTWMDPFVRTCHAVNDLVYVKWVGGSSTTNPDADEVVYPNNHHVGWYLGRIVSIDSCEKSSAHEEADTTTNGHKITTSHTNAAIELYDHVSKIHWTVALPISPSSSPGRHTILGGLPFGFGFDPSDCVKVIAHMAKSSAYFDTTLPSNVDVKVKCSDGKYYSARTLCRTEIPWQKVNLESELDLSGPCVPLLWEDDGSISFEPTASCVVKDIGRATASKSIRERKQVLAELSDAEGSVSTPLEAILASLACGGKEIADRPNADDTELEAYDAEDKVWSKVQVLPSLEVKDTPLKVLAYHMCYPESDRFSVVYWESDMSLSLIPNSYLRPRQTGDDDSDDDSSDEEESYDIGSEHEQVRKYIEECYSGNISRSGSADESMSSSRKHVLTLGSLTLIFGVGFILGAKSKR